MAVGIVGSALERPWPEGRRQPRHQLHQPKLFAPLHREVLEILWQYVGADLGWGHLDERRLAAHGDLSLLRPNR